MKTIALPKSRKSIASTPEASTPEASTPEASTPEASTPEASTPEASTPEATTEALTLTKHFREYFNQRRHTAKVTTAARDVEHIQCEARRGALNLAERFGIRGDSRGILDGVRLAALRKALVTHHDALINAASGPAERDHRTAAKNCDLSMIDVANAFTKPGFAGALFMLLKTREATVPARVLTAEDVLTDYVAPATE